MVATARALGPELDWLPDDTEEALVGASEHQLTIVNLYDGATNYSRRARLPWFVGNQLKLIIPRRGGRSYQPSPDFCIHPTRGPGHRASLDVVRDGPPFLAVEIASPSTAFAHDLDTANPRAKPTAYALAGIAEYLVYDHTARIIPERVRAWRLGPDGRYVPWLPAADGRWHSGLGISLVPEGVLLRLYDPQGQPIPTIWELADQAEALERDNTALRAELRRLRGE